jgi:hypothetical protein
VYLVSFSVALPPEIMLLGAVLGGGYLLFAFVFRFAADTTASPTVLAWALFGIVLLAVNRLARSPDFTWLVAFPAALGTAHLVGRSLANGHAHWCASLLTAPRAERARAIDWWKLDVGFCGTVVAACPVWIGYGAALAAKSTGRPDGLALASFFGATFAAWCLFGGAGTNPFHCCYVGWRVVKLALTYNAPLPSGRVREEPFTALAAVFLCPLVTWPDGKPSLFDLRVTLDWLLRVGATAALVVAVPFGIAFTVLCAGFAAPAADHSGRRP